MKNILILLTTLLLFGCFHEESNPTISTYKDTTTFIDTIPTIELSGVWIGEVIREDDVYCDTLSSQLSFVEDKYFKYIYNTPYKIHGDTLWQWYTGEIYETGHYTISDGGVIAFELLDREYSVYSCDSLGNNKVLENNMEFYFETLSNLISKPNDTTLIINVEYEDGLISKGEYLRDGE
jgi:hypothetical protein